MALKMSKLDCVQERLHRGIESLRKIIEANVAQKGDRSEDCQKLLLIERLNDFEYAVNGLEQSDLVVKGRGK